MFGHIGHVGHAHHRRVAANPLSALGDYLGLNDDSDNSKDAKATSKTTQQQKVTEERDAAADPATVVSVVYMTASPTFTGAIAGYSTQGQAIDTEDKKTAASNNAAPTEVVNTQDDVATSAIATSALDTAQSITGLPTEISAAPTSFPNSMSLLAATDPLQPSTRPTTTSPSAQSASSSAAPTKTSGMSAGGLAGVVIGVLLIVGAILSLVLFCFKKRRNKMKREQEDNEKNPFGDAAAIDHAIPPATPKNAPRLSLRPVTQFLPYGADKRRSAGIPLANTTQDQNRNNPFGNHAEAIDTTNANGPPVVQGVGSSGDIISTPKAAGAVGTGAIAGAAVATLTRGASKRDVNKPMDFTKTGPLGPPSPTGTEFSETADNAAQPTQTNTGAAIAAAGGPQTSSVHRVQLDFKPSMDDELELRAGQLIRLLHEYDDGWAMCIRLDRSQQGVVPRTCLSNRPVKPRPQNGPLGMRQGPPRGPGMNQGPPYPMGPGRQGPPRGPMNQGPRQLTPGMQGRPMSPAMNQGPRSMSPAMNQGVPRSMSPAPLRPLTPNGQPRPSTPNGQGARPMTPTGSGVPRPLTPQSAPRPMTPNGQNIPRSMTPTNAAQSMTTSQPQQSNISPPSERSLPQVPQDHQNPSPVSPTGQNDDVSPISTASSPPSMHINRKPLPGQAL